MKIQPGTLYVVGTPIGNLEDMTFRAIEVLRQVDWIAAEDTRHTGVLLHHFQITTSQLSYHDHNRSSRTGELIQRLRQGQAIALVTDAGIPGISDPGYELIVACIKADCAVVPIPGVTAAVTGLMASGLPTNRFVFEGFLPTKSKERGDRLAQLQQESRTIILYEAPHRLLQTLQDLATTIPGDRAIVISRELTKLYEEFWRGSLSEAIAHYSQTPPKGEFTVILQGNTDQPIPPSETVLKTELKALLAQGFTRSQASRTLAKQTQLPRQQIYQLSLTLDNDPEGSIENNTDLDLNPECKN